LFNICHKFFASHAGETPLRLAAVLATKIRKGCKLLPLSDALAFHAELQINNAAKKWYKLFPGSQNSFQSSIGLLDSNTLRVVEVQSLGPK
jgi:hypothetical protein